MDNVFWFSVVSAICFGIYSIIALIRGGFLVRHFKGDYTHDGAGIEGIVTGVIAAIMCFYAVMSAVEVRNVHACEAVGIAHSATTAAPGVAPVKVQAEKAPPEKVTNEPENTVENE